MSRRPAKPKKALLPPPVPTRGSGTRVVGLDLSLVGTAGVELLPSGVVGRILYYTSTARQAAAPRRAGVTVIRAQPVALGDSPESWQRTRSVAEAVLAFVAEGLPGCVGIEGHAFSSQGASVYQLGHLHGLIRYGLQAGGLEFAGPRVPFRVYGPSLIKNYATGNGSANKEKMIAAARRAGFDASAYGLLPRDDGQPDEDGPEGGLSDAYWCARLLQLELWVRQDPDRLHQMPAEELALFGEHIRSKKGKDGKQKRRTIPGLLDQPFFLPE